MALSVELPASVSQSDNVLYHILSNKKSLLTWAWSCNNPDNKHQGQCVEPLRLTGLYKDVLYTFKVVRKPGDDSYWHYSYQAFFNDNATCLTKGWIEVKASITNLALDNFWDKEGSVFMDVSTLYK